MRHPEVVTSLIFKYCLKVNIHGQNRPQIVPKFSLDVSVQELHNILVCDPEDGGLKEAKDAENNIIISNSTLPSLFSTHLLKYHQDKRSCMVLNVVHMPKVYNPRYCHGVIGILKT